MTPAQHRMTADSVRPYGRRKPREGDVVRIEMGGYPRWIDHLHGVVTSVRGRHPDAVWVKLLHKPPAIETPRGAWRYGTHFHLPKRRLALLIDGDGA